jgi:glycosyltransferase involved in cell wall biosynthesis
MANQKISIAMCTYNGAANISEQLQSFASQTRLPDELIVCDDCSSDETVEIVRHFTKLAPFDVRLMVNEANLGFAGNFSKSLEFVTGDVVFLSDQDDVWLPTKLEKFMDIFEKDPAVGLVFCDANLVDAALLPLGATWWQSRRFGRSARRALTGLCGAAVLLKDSSWMAAGATMAFSSRYLDAIMPIPKGWTHDAWIATVVSAMSRVELIVAPLNQYRQHTAQVYGATMSKSTTFALAFARGSSTDHFLATANRYGQLRDLLRNPKFHVLCPKFRKMIEAKIAHWMLRAEMRNCSFLKQFALIVREMLLGRYHKYSQAWKSIALDFVAIFR